jgi:hypothetical protein
MLYVIGQWIIICGSVGVYAIVIALYCIIINPRYFKQRTITNQRVYIDDEDEDDDVSEWNVL